jgi:hypothetical protein
MSEAGKANRLWTNKGLWKWLIVTSIISGVGKQLLMGLVAMPRPLAFLLSELLALFVAYDYLPDPKWSFRKYATILASLLIGGVFAVYVAAPYLETYLPTVVAYGIPLLLYGALIYFIFKYGKRQMDIQKNS